MVHNLHPHIEAIDFWGYREIGILHKLAYTSYRIDLIRSHKMVCTYLTPGQLSGWVLHQCGILPNVIFYRTIQWYAMEVSCNGGTPQSSI